jgi:hypothetical protein
MSPDNDWLKEYVKEVGVTYRFNEIEKCRSTSKSLDVNDHIVELVGLINQRPASERQGGWIDIYYRGKRMFIGDGPRISRESIRLIADLNAEIGQDIYCMCSDP